MSVSKELLDRFFRDQCNAAESKQVVDYLKDHPMELEAWFNENEEPVDGQGCRLHPAVSDKMLTIIRNETRQRRHFGWVKYAAAACLIGVCSIILLSRLNVGKSPVAARVFRGSDQAPVRVKPTLQVKVNHSGKPMVVELEDGSEFTLAPSSSLTYYQPFESDRRSFELSGSAFFTVAKDEKRPFMVAGDGFITTALGTSFRMIAMPESHTVMVQLYTGKVRVGKDRVGKDRTLKGGSFEDVYLLPGQQLQIDRGSLACRVDKMHSGSRAGGERDGIAIMPEGLAFKQTPLPVLLRLLEKRYEVKIIFSEKEVSMIRFTGEFDSSENIASLLNTIAELNGLVVVKTDGGYEVRK